MQLSHPGLQRQATYATIERLERSSDRREIPALPNTMLHETDLLDSVVSNAQGTIAVRGFKCQRGEEVAAPLPAYRPDAKRRLH